MGILIDVGAAQLVTPHTVDEDYHEWVAGPTVQRDWLGRQNGATYEWVELICNNPECPGFARFRIQEMGRLVDEVAEYRRELRLDTGFWDRPALVDTGSADG